MCTRLYIILFSLLVVTPHALGATKYLDNTCANNGNGSTVTCGGAGGSGPFNSLSNAANCVGMSSGDILQIRGRGDPYRTTGSVALKTDCNGTIWENYPGEVADLRGEVDISGSTWTHQGGNVYYCTSGTCGVSGQFPFTAWYDVGGGEQRLNLIQSNETCDSSLAAGYMRYNSTANQVCAHLHDGSSPANALYFYIPTASAILAPKTNSVTNLTFRRHASGGEFKVWRAKRYAISTSAANTNLVIDGLYFGWVMDRGLNMADTSGTGNITVRNSTIEYAGQEGLRCELATGGCIFEYNTVRHIQTSPVFELCSPSCQSGFSDNGTAIRNAASSGSIIRYNTVHDVGGGDDGNARGINCEFSTPNCQVYANFIYRVQGFGSGTGTAILWSGGNGDAMSGTAIYNNRIWDTDVCIGSQSAGTLGPGTITVESNTCVNPDISGWRINFGSDSHTVTWRNNIIMALDAAPSSLLITIPSGATNFGTPTYGAYYCPVCSGGGGDIISWKGTTYERNGDCTASDCVTDLDGNSVYGDPNLNTTQQEAPGSPAPNLHIRTAAGVALNAGTSAVNANDCCGTVRPIGPGYDIGAHELLYDPGGGVPGTNICP